MHQQEIGPALNAALGDKLTLVNKGFVQSLCLRFVQAKTAAELAYADNLAETRRVMTLIREMQRLGISLDPDGADSSHDRGEPDLKAREKEIWLSDLKLANRNRDALKRARKAFATSGSRSKDCLWLDNLITEGEAFATELECRSRGVYEVRATKATAPAQGNSLEHFLESLEDLDSRLLAGRTEATRGPTGPLFSVLNSVLCNQFLAIEQFFLQGFLLVQCGHVSLGEVRIRHSLDEMVGAFRVAQRILLLGSVPRPFFLPQAKIPYRIRVGSDAMTALKNDLALTESLIESLDLAAARTQADLDSDTLNLISLTINEEKKAEQRLRSNLEALATDGIRILPSGQFDTMLTRWAVT